MVLKFKSKLSLKFMSKGSETIKTMKMSKKRRGLTQVKAIFLTYKQRHKEEISIYYDNKEIHTEKILFLAVLSVASIILTCSMQNQFGKNI